MTRVPKFRKVCDQTTPKWGPMSPATVTSLCCFITHSKLTMMSDSNLRQSPKIIEVFVGSMFGPPINPTETYRNPTAWILIQHIDTYWISALVTGSILITYWTAEYLILIHIELFVTYISCVLIIVGLHQVPPIPAPHNTPQNLTTVGDSPHELDAFPTSSTS